jgi:L-threonylcarbamoyladenylate synthase
VTAAQLSVAGLPVPPAALAAAADVLWAGGVVGIPTDTVYGLAVDPWQPGAADRVFAAKGRPRGVELPVLVADRAQVARLCPEVPAAAERLMARFWPGGLTVVVPRHPGSGPEGTGPDLGDNGTSVGVRCPDHPVPRALCALVGPLATTSANRHGAPPASEADEVAILPGVALVLDGGTRTGLASTVVDCSRPGPPLLLRAGRVPWAEILAELGLATPGDGGPGRPGWPEPGP